MPNVDAELRLVGEEVRRELDEASFVEWGGGVPLATHLEREQALRDTAWARGSLSTWVWEADGERLASCETYAVPSQVDGVAGTTWEIASVFTPEAHRGRGHASRMLAALIDQLALVTGAQALLCFSDVGEAMYARLGFVGLPAWDRVFPAKAGEVAGTRPLALHDLARHWPRGPETGEEGYVRVPSPEQLAWHLCAAAHGARAAGREPAREVGALSGSGAIVWAEDHQMDQLRVLDLIASGPEEAARLLAAAQDAAARAGLTAVVAWESVDGAEWPEELGARMPRRGAVPMLLPLLVELDAEGWRRVPRGLWV